MTGDSASDARLDPAPEQIRAMGAAAIELVANYLGSLEERPLMPVTTRREVRAEFDVALPVEGTDFSSLLAVIESAVIPNMRHNAHPRFFGYIASPGTAATALADLIASTLNPTVTSWRSAPAAAELETMTVDWIKEILGYPESALGLYVSGGSLANLSALAVARESALATSVVKSGLQATARPLRLYLATEGHHSTAKAAALLGIGYDNVCPIAVDRERRMDVAHLIRSIDADLAAGHQPFCVVASAGTTATGAVDPLAAIAEVAAQYGLWFHVDACYGGFAALSPAIRRTFAGIERSNSVSLDPHKWLYVPGDCGCVLYRDPAAARATFGHDADYIRVIGQEPPEAFAFWDCGPELSRRFRALKVWMMFKHVGTRALGGAVEANCDCAEYAGRLIAEAEDLELLAPIGLSVFCFRFVPPGRAEPAESGEERNRRLNALNEKLLAVLQRQGNSYVSNAEVDGRFALRGCVLNYRTTRQDMEILLDDVRRAGAEVVRTHP